MAKYPHAIQHPSEIQHPSRDETRGIVIHWTAGHKAGDLEALNGPLVDVQFYVDTAGEVYQFLDSGAQAWHAMHTANHTCIGIEHEGSGEAWTDQQLEASAKLAAWLTKLYNIPLTNVDPPNQWHGFFGHKDLVGFEKNDHSDTCPPATGWDKYFERIKFYAENDSANRQLADADSNLQPTLNSLKVTLQPKGGAQKVWTGPDAVWALRWILGHGLNSETKAIAVQGKTTYKGAEDVYQFAKTFVAQHSSETPAT
jgi:N-acetyl-anhydromuramyl-L-alanine amidase AmpD